MLPSAKEKERLETDAFYRLEKTTKDAEVAAIKKDAVEALLEANHRTWSDPYSLNYSLRKRLRVYVLRDLISYITINRARKGLSRKRPKRPTRFARGLVSRYRCFWNLLQTDPRAKKSTLHLLLQTI